MWRCWQQSGTRSEWLETGAVLKTPGACLLRNSEPLGPLLGPFELLLSHRCCYQHSTVWSASWKARVMVPSRKPRPQNEFSESHTTEERGKDKPLGLRGASSLLNHQPVSPTAPPPSPPTHPTSTSHDLGRRWTSACEEQGCFFSVPYVIFLSWGFQMKFRPWVAQSRGFPSAIIWGQIGTNGNLC